MESAFCNVRTAVSEQRNEEAWDDLNYDGSKLRYNLKGTELAILSL